MKESYCGLEYFSSSILLCESNSSGDLSLVKPKNAWGIPRISRVGDT